MSVVEDDVDVDRNPAPGATGAAVATVVAYKEDLQQQHNNQYSNYGIDAAQSHKAPALKRIRKGMTSSKKPVSVVTAVVVGGAAYNASDNRLSGGNSNEYAVAQPVLASTQSHNNFAYNNNDGDDYQYDDDNDDDDYGYDEDDMSRSSKVKVETKNAKSSGSGSGKSKRKSKRRLADSEEGDGDGSAAPRASTGGSSHVFKDPAKAVELATFYQRVVKPQREHNALYPPPQYTFCLICDAYVCRDYCTCGVALAEHGLDATGHYPMPAMRFDNILHANVCTLHGRSEPFMHPLRQTLRLLYEDIVPKLCTYFLNQQSGGHHNEHGGSDDNDNNSNSSAGVGVDLLAPANATTLYLYEDTLQVLSELSVAYLVQQPEAKAILRRIKHWSDKYGEVYNARLADPKSAASIAMAFSRGDAQTNGFFPTTVPQNVVELVRETLQEFSMRLRFGSACQLVIKRLFCAFNKHLPFMQQGRDACDDMTFPEMLVPTGMPKYHHSATEVKKVLCNTNGFFSTQFTRFMAHLYGCTAQLRVPPGHTSDRPMGTRAWRTTVQKAETAACYEQGLKPPVVDHESILYMLGSRCAELHEKIVDDVGRCQLTSKEPRKLVFPDDFYPETAANNQQQLVPRVPFSETETILLVYDAQGNILRVVNNTFIDDAGAHPMLRLRDRVKQVSDGINRLIDAMKKCAREYQHLANLEAASAQAASAQAASTQATFAQATIVRRGLGPQ